MRAVLEHHFVATNGIRLHVVQAGPEQGPVSLLLHGFPEGWFGWRRQIEPLAAAGYRVWAPDLRGYNTSDKPRGAAKYRMDELVADVAGLIAATGQPQVNLVAHDWGAAVAWVAAGRFPERLRRLVILNVPHPAVMLRALQRNPRQMLRSWYILAVQVPWLPEALARCCNWRSFVAAIRSSARPGTFTDEDMALYREAWSQPGAFSAMLNWYRGMARHGPWSMSAWRVNVPTLILWGVRDVALGRELAQPSIDLCDHGKLVFFEEATHWLQHEEPQRVNELIVEFLSDEFLLV